MAVRPRRRGLRVSPAHGKKRLVLNILGVVLLVVGVTLFVGGLTIESEAHDEWSDHVGGDEEPFWERGKTYEDTRRDTARARKELREKQDDATWRIVVGMFSSLGGIALLAFANQRVFARYQAGEMVPVAEDAAEDLSPTISSIASAVSEGIRRGAGESGTPETDSGGRIRHRCGTLNDPEDRFCKGCGEDLGNPVCPSCGKENDADARFCDGCGAGLA